MAARRQKTTVLWWLIVICVIASAEEQQQHALVNPTADQDLAQVDQQEMRSMVSRLESRVEALERSFESRVESLEGEVVQLRSNADELYDLMYKQIYNQKSQQAKLESELEIQSSLIDKLANRIYDHESEFSKITAIIQQSQSPELSSQPAQNKTEQNSTSDKLLHPRDCSDLPEDSPTATYLVYPDRSRSVRARCDMDTDGGGWTVIQRRDDIRPRKDFYRGWSDYKTGFGVLTGEFWWGLEHVWHLTSASDRQYVLRVDLDAFDGDQAYAIYTNFSVSSESDGYRLSVSNYSGDAGDGLEYGVNSTFSTHDRIPEDTETNCAHEYQGAWWYGSCGLSNLNGRYVSPGGDPRGIWWGAWLGLTHLMKTEMKIRPA
ncbi:microfibril-associated glycoprotein 4-like [Amphibalanus amphitrite]|uniref:microfibril-associated glycoprotein 4-like n=1 Tax=Amphibalanus amphitrite TaxID=1232801 RepID=UPI001C91A39C|nr:microfibril-associated glycoprotein 4-like [Amphibalanus amphitrite]